MSNELNILRVDLDCLTLSQVFNILNKRLAYMNDIGFLFFKNIKKIEYIKKSKYSVKIYLNFNLKTQNNVVLFETLLGSDYRKGINTLINYHKLNMSYSNRMFDIKKYKDGSYIESQKGDITNLIKSFIENKKRRIYKN